MPFFQRVNDLVEVPEDPKEFEDGVVSAIKQLYRDGSRSMKMCSIYSVTRWKRDSSTSRRIYYVLKKYGVKKMNNTHYTMGRIAEMMEKK